ncbi:S66 peptidase family protein [Desulfarculus baarsii]
MTAARAPIWPRPGRAVAVTAPAGRVEPVALAAGLEALRALAGQRPLLAEGLATAEGYLAGPDQQRAARLGQLWADEAVDLIVCARGGFGSSRLLPLLDLPAMAAAGKCLLGFSDITCLVLALAGRGLVGLHGPVLTQLPRLDQASLADVSALLAGRPPWPGRLTGQGAGGGVAEGPLLGGNLTMLCHLVGTPWQPDLDGAILCLEDTGEAPYRLDRMITKLELTGLLDRVAGVALGGLDAAGQSPPEHLEALMNRLRVRGLPLVWDLPFGHGARNRILPMGARARLDGAAGLLETGLDL